MTRLLPVRLLCFVCALATLPAWAQTAPGQSNVAASQPARSLNQIARRSGVRGEHLAEWLQQHAGLTPEQQQQALAAEPGFRELPPQTQQRMRDRLTQLDNMSPAQRRRIIAHTEAMERLDPAQRQQVRAAMQQLSQLPPERRAVVERTFRSMRYLPPARQTVYLNNPAVRGAFNEQELATLNNLMAVEPLLPRQK